MNPRHAANNSSGDQFDAFLSYSRKDANYARSIADLLISNGLHIWFDEYQIPKIPISRTGISEETLEEAITRGVANSKAGILITNTEFSKSQPCMELEAGPLLKRTPQIPILNIGRPATPEVAIKFRNIAPHLGTEPQEVRTFDDVVEQLERFFNRRFEKDSYALEPVERNKLPWKINGHAVTLNAAGWDLVSSQPAMQSGDVAGPSVVRTVDGYRLDINVFVGKTGWKRESLARELSHETRDSRWKYYEWGIGMAQWVCTGRSPRLDAKMKAEIAKFSPVRRVGANLFLIFARFLAKVFGRSVRGVHVFQHNGLDQFAVTYHGRSVGWTRKYSLSMPDPDGGSDFEFVFTGGCNGSLEDFCRYAHRIDEYVLSLNFEQSQAHS